MSTPPTDLAEPAQWTPQEAGRLYGLDRWGQQYFRVNAAGHVSVHPTREAGRAIDLKLLIDALRQRDLHPPVLIRFTDILRDRLNELAGAFSRAIETFDYQGGYRCVYPIKVNQQRQVVEDIQAFGAAHGFGLEAGSKPELLAIMAMVDSPRTPIICNGFKDARYVEAIILASKMGKHVIPVVEKYSELERILHYARAHGVRPQIGLRAKLATPGAGRWEQSGGPRSKFGLFISEITEALAALREAEMLDCLKLLHFHLGSQVSDIRSLKSALTEMGRLYAELHAAGAGVEYLDVGGGLGVDYHGGKSDASSSMNYDLQEYANDVVYHVREQCEAAGVPHPTLISESGRALTAYHSVLIFDVLEASGYDRFDLPAISGEQLKELPAPVRMLYESARDVNADNFLEYFHDAQLARRQVLELFNLGHCSLQQRSLGERLYFDLCRTLLRLIQDSADPPAELSELEPALAETYICNFSIFQSMPDTWAIDHRFPIMPVHRLNERPSVRATLADITCDSDGRIDRFISDRHNRPVLELHPLEDEPYYLGAFLVGAYQEILGDLHNLFGDTNAVHVSLDEENGFRIDEMIEGETVSDVLRHVQFDPDGLRRRFGQAIERSLRAGQLSTEEARLLRRFYEEGLQGYTYLT